MLKHLFSHRGLVVLSESDLCNSYGQVTVQSSIIERANTFKNWQYFDNPNTLQSLLSLHKTDCVTLDNRYNGVYLSYHSYIGGYYSLRSLGHIGLDVQSNEFSRQSFNSHYLSIVTSSLLIGVYAVLSV